MDRRENIPMVNNDVLFDILKLLPANFLYYHGKYVCDAWARIVSDPVFIERHLLLSSPGIVMPADVEQWHACFLHVILGNLRMKRLAPAFEGAVTESCDGVMLLCDKIRLVNPVTMQEVHLPVLPNPHDASKSSIGRVRRTGRFKVVCIVCSEGVSCHWLVLTVGEDTSWRRVDITIDKDMDAFDDCGPFSIGDTVYLGLGKESTPGTSIYAFHLDDETTYKIWVPGSCLFLLEMNGALGRRKVVDHDGEGYIEVDILKDFHKDEWVNIVRLRNWENWHETFTLWSA